MNYEQAIDYLYGTLPMFQRIGAVAYKKDLTNTIALCEKLDDPHQKFKSIHIAGTNGKGSSSHMLAAILQQSGYKTGLYTSPHLKDFTERIRVNGVPVSKAFVTDFVERMQPHLESIKPSFFETTVAMAFDYFAQEKVDFGVIEVGLGGRLDSTNVITPEVALITNISWDHMDLLGDTLAAIAGEKAGIIKESVPVVISEHAIETDDVFTNIAQANKSVLTFASDIFYVTPLKNGSYEVKTSNNTFTVTPDLKGIYQQKNIAGVLATIEVLRKKGVLISQSAIIKALENVVALTGLKGRWQTIGRSPLTICDTGHNEAGVNEILKQIKLMEFNNLHFVWGMVKDKDITRILKLLPADASYYFCEAKIPRSLDANLLQQQASVFGLKGKVIKDVNEAITTARNEAGINDLILVGGSTFVVAEVENL